MALPIPQRLAEINVEIQNVENALRNTRRMLNGFLRQIYKRLREPGCY